MSLVIGAAGAVGKRLIGALAARGENVVAAMRSTPLPDHLQTAVQRQVMNVDQGNIDALRKIFKRHPEIHTVWNMQVVRARSADAEATVGGMKNLLEVMQEYDVNKMIFADSIASFSAAAPRKDCPARWLQENPDEEPVAEIGNQKRECRALLKSFGEAGGDGRYAVIPSVLHIEAAWGAGLTSYPLDAMRAAVDGLPYVCPVDTDKALPMIYVDDLVRGLLDLADAPQNMLYEPCRGYALPGFSMTPEELFAEIRRMIPEFDYTTEIDPTLHDLAMSWPDNLSNKEAARDLGYRAAFGIEETVQRILRAYTARRQPRAVSAEMSSIGEPASNMA
jgi:threonine 3-dehydrogenase